MDISRLTVPSDATVREVIAKIDANGYQIALVVDGNGRLVGVITDGDVRRGILRGVPLEASAAETMNRRPQTATPEFDEDELMSVMQVSGIRQVPVVDADSRVVGLFAPSLTGASTPVNTPVVLMAGGRGQRLYPLTKDVPKPMLPIGETPLLGIILTNLAGQGFVNVHISVNYLADVIIDYVGDGSRFGLAVDYLHEEKPLGTAGALAQLDGLVDEPFVVMNSDLLTHVNLRRLVRFHRKQAAKATVGVREHSFEIPFGVVNLEGARVASIVEKPMHRTLVNAGIYVLDPFALRLLPRDDYCDMPTLISLVMGQGQLVSAFPIHEQWLDVGRPEDLDQARTESLKWMGDTL